MMELINSFKKDKLKKVVTVEKNKLPTKQEIEQEKKDGICTTPVINIVSTDNWYYINAEDIQIGPINNSQLKQNWKANKFNGNSQVWCPGMPKWLSVKDYPDLNKFLDVDPDPIAILPPSRSQGSSSLPTITAISATSTTTTTSAVKNPKSMVVSVSIQIPELLKGNKEIKITIKLDPQQHMYITKEEILKNLTNKKLFLNPSKMVAKDFALKQSMDSLTTIGRMSLLKNVVVMAQPELVLVAQKSSSSAGKSPSPSLVMPDEETINAQFKEFITEKGFEEPFSTNMNNMLINFKWDMLDQHRKNSLKWNHLRSDSIREGQLKKSPRLKKWKKRDPKQLTEHWFLLFPDRFEYNKKGKNKKRGSIPLNAATQAHADDFFGMPNTFVIIPNTGKHTGELYCFQALSKDDRDSWVQTISNVISCIPTGKKTEKPKNEIDEKHYRFELTNDMMLGLRTSLGKLGSIPQNEQLTTKDMDLVERIDFPSAGSKLTQPHRGKDFYFKDYCPKVFRRIRARFGIDPVSYLLDVCGNHQYLEFQSNSKSGQFFFHTHNRKYMIKTISHNESRTLKTMMPQFYRHMMSHKNTLLTPFFGLHKVAVGRSNYWFLIMGSVFPTQLKMDLIFDLKGSTRHREVKPHEKQKKGVCFKDNDFVEQNIRIKVGRDIAEKLITQLKRDAEYLGTHKIIDYSILLGIHNVTKIEKENLKKHGSIFVEDPHQIVRSLSGVPSSISEEEERYSHSASIGDIVPPKTQTTISTTSVILHEEKIPEIPGPVTTWKNNVDRLSNDLQNVITMDVNGIYKLTQEEFTKLLNGNNLAFALYSELLWAKSPEYLADSQTQIRGREMYQRTASRKRIMNRPGNRSQSGGRLTEYSQTESEDISQLSDFTIQQGGLLSEEGDVLYFIGIIDTLIEYGTLKQAENAFKVKVKHIEEQSISVVAPATYATRFLEFITKYIE